MEVYAEGGLKKKRGRNGVQVYIKTKFNPIAPCQPVASE